MRNQRTSAVLTAVLLATALGCGGDTVKHDEADNYLIEGINASATDKAKAIDLFTKAIDAKPTAHAYFRRGWLYAQQNDDEKAKADARDGLKLQSDNQELKWLETQLKKPADKRSLDMPPAVTK